MSFELPLLFGAGFLAGILNSIAGGGSFITFPALLLAGLPPIAANATNTFASVSGYLSGAYGFRKDLRRYRRELPKFMAISFIGGISGAWLLLQTPETVFRTAIPWLLLFATVLFVFGGALNKLFLGLASRHRHASALGRSLMVVLLLGVCIYGGFFNAGLGIIILSYLALAGFTDINAMNGLKLLTSSAVSLVAIVLFIVDGVIVWEEGLIVLVGTLIGGYIAARISRRLPQAAVRRFVILASTAITAYFFFETYGG